MTEVNKNIRILTANGDNQDELAIRVERIVNKSGLVLKDIKYSTCLVSPLYEVVRHFALIILEDV
jgi:hypothetical protein